MTARDDFDRHVAAWLSTDAPTSEPEHLLGEVLARTARTRRRSAWRIPERWISMSAITSRVATPPGVPWRAIALAALLIALIAGAVLVAGSLRHRVAPPFGPAANGAVYYSMNGDLMAADSPIATPRTILGGDTFDNGALLSPDGTRMVFVRGEIGDPDAELWTAASDGSKPHLLVDVPKINWAEWSPQSDAVAVLLGDSPSTIQIVNANDGSVREIDTGLLAVDNVIWRPPDGAQLTLRARDSSDQLGHLRDRAGRHGAATPRPRPRVQVGPELQRRRGLLLPESELVGRRNAAALLRAGAGPKLAGGSRVPEPRRDDRR